MKNFLKTGLAKPALFMLILLILNLNPLLAAFAFQKVTPMVWGLFIGISKYQVDEFSLDYAARDASAMKQVISGQNNMTNNRNYKLLINEDATKLRIKNDFDWLDKMAKPMDTVVIYFSGHGTSYNQFTTGQNGILPYDALPISRANDITFPELLRWVYSLRVYEVVLIIDACGSGEILNHIGLKGFIEAENRYHAPNVTFILSTKNRERAKESSSEMHGIFTKYFIEGIQGSKADRSDGRISAREAFDYAIIKMKRNNFPQVPVYYSEIPAQAVFLTGFGMNNNRKTVENSRGNSIEDPVSKFRKNEGRLQKIYKRIRKLRPENE